MQNIAVFQPGLLGKLGEFNAFGFTNNQPPNYTLVLQANNNRIGWFVQNSSYSLAPIVLFWLDTNADPLDPANYFAFRELQPGESTGENMGMGSVRQDNLYCTIHPLANPGDLAYFAMTERTNKPIWANS